MTRYLLTLYQPDRDPPVDDPAAVARALDALEAEARSKGVWLFAGGLGKGASVVRKGLVTDGPYVEGKEHVGGFVVVEVANYDEAVAWAGRLGEAAKLPVELRPLAWAHA